MDSRRLHCFVALAEELHFRRAAERCHLTQSGLSQQLKTLEDELQVNLVYRTKRHVSLTQAGEVFLVEARKTLAQADQAVHLARRTAHGEIGQLFVGATAPAMFIVLPEIVRLYRARRPEVGLIVREMNTIEQEVALRSGEIDAGIAHPPLDDATLACRPIAELPFKLVISGQNALARQPVLRIDDLGNEHFILFPRRIGPRLYDAIIGMCQSAGFSPQIILEASPAQSIVALAAAGFGVGWIASELQQFARPGVVYRALTGNAPYLPIAVAYRPKTVSPALESFLAIAIEVGRAAR
jgi:DNA-binding transcriptional LysR family regulator